ncbi:MAG: carboxypeptidase-like regulatory domain-containing protein [Gemmatimonadota bacterium]
MATYRTRKMPFGERRLLGPIVWLLRMASAFALPTILAAQAAPAATGMLRGTLNSVDNDAPIAFALVRIVAVGDSAATPTAVLQQAISSATGQFSFVAVPVGTYRLQVARIGYQPILSSVLHIAGGASVRQDLRLPSTAIQLAAVTVRANPPCLTATELHNEPATATLWAEAQKGMQIRREFERQYRFTMSMQQVVHVQWRLKKSGPDHRRATLLSEPDSVPVREARLRARRAKEGYANGNQVALPDDKELLDDDFLRTHCLESSIAEGQGVVGLRFRPIGKSSGNTDVRGTIWIDASTYHVHHVNLEYVEGENDVFAAFRVDYAPVAVGPATMHLRIGGEGVLFHLRGVAAMLAQGARATFAFSYMDVQLARTLGESRL